MKTFQSLLPAFGLVAAAQAWGNDWNNTHTTVTITTDIYTTVCPSATTFTQGNKTYTATESETITITDCPCTYVKTTTYPPTSSASIVPPPISSPSAVPPPISVNGTISSPPQTVSKTVSYFTTYCPSSTVVTIGTQTISLSSGTQTVPIISPTVITSIGTISPPTKTPVGPSSSTTGLLQVTNAAMRFEAGAGAIAAAGLAALLL